jgi:predicted nucleotidyltransferase
MSLIQALFTDSQARVWQWVFGLPERSFHLSELRRLTGLGSASLQRELNRLADAGLLQTERVGNLRCFKANADSPVYSELVALTAKTLGVSAQLQKVLQPLAGRLQWVGVYGSVAKKTDKAGSDVDVMLVGDDLRLSEVLDCLAPLERSLGRKINPACYSRAEFFKRREQDGSFVQQVLAQPVVTLMGSLDGNR